MSTGKKFGLAVLASAVMAAPAYGQAYGQGERVVCTRDFNGAVVCPQPQQQQVYVPTGPAQQQPRVVVEQQQPSPVATFVTGLALGVLGAVAGNAIANRGHHHGGPGYVGGSRYVDPADIPRLDNNPWSPNYGRCVTPRGSVQACR